MCHFHKGLGFVYMHETTKCVVINNFENNGTFLVGWSFRLKVGYELCNAT